MPVTFRDAYTDKPQGARAVLVERLRCLRVQLWSDPGDRELRAEIERCELELQQRDAAAWERSG